MASYSPWRGRTSARLPLSTLILLCVVHFSAASASRSAEVETIGSLQAAEDRISFDQQQGKYEDGEVEMLGPDEPMQEESRQVPQYVRGGSSSTELSDEELIVQRNAAMAAQQYRGKSSGNKYGKHKMQHAPQVQESEDISQPINVQYLDSELAGSASVANRAVPNSFNGNAYSLDASSGGRPGLNAYSNIESPAYHGLDFKYHDYEKMTKFLRQTSSRYPNLTALYSIGKSVQDNSEQTYLAAFWAIPFLLDSVAVYCPRTKKLWRPTKLEVKDGFICHIPRTFETGISCSERFEKMNALGLTLQPHIVIFGESLDNISKIEVVVNNVHYTLPPTDGIVTAVDTCFKSFHVLNV